MNAPDRVVIDNQSKTTSAVGTNEALNWRASLNLAYASSAGRTVPTRREHRGPLRILKGYAAAAAQADLWEQIIVHPPGGVAAGDSLAINVEAGANTHVLLTSPGATKWYRGSRDHERVGPAQQRVRIRVDDQACLEWLPLENIFFNGADARLQTQVDLAPRATLICAELNCLGRVAGQDPFVAGNLQLSTRITREGQPLFIERGLINPIARSCALRSAAGLNGHACFGTLLAVPPVGGGQALGDLVATARGRATCANAQQAEALAVTALPDLIVARWRGDSVQGGWAALRALWHQLRPPLLGSRLAEPRIWHC